MLYRVEDAEGKGPYRDPDDADDFRYKMMCRHSEDTDNHPIPQQEGFDMGSNYFCCFSSLTQLKNWFTQEELQGLYERGYRVYEVKGDLAAELPKQSIMFRGYKKVGELSLADLL